MRLIRFTLSALALAVAASSIARAADTLLAQAMLVAASDKPGATAKKLSPYEPNLKAVLRFESYRLIGDSTAQLGLQQEQAIDLGNGHRLEVEVLKISGDRARTRVKWFFNGKQIVNTVITLKRGSPAVLGGLPRNADGEVLAVLILVV